MKKHVLLNDIFVSNSLIQIFWFSFEFFFYYKKYIENYFNSFNFHTRITQFVDDVANINFSLLKAT